MGDLNEVKTDAVHYYEDESGRKQGEYKLFHNGKITVYGFYKNNNLHGEFKVWDLDEMLQEHSLYVDGKKEVDFIKNPDAYPKTDEDKTAFILRYGSGPFIKNH